jgi:hypothetical protein
MLEKSNLIDRQTYSLAITGIFARYIMDESHATLNLLRFEDHAGIGVPESDVLDLNR